ncbi:hypothetical protein CYMTET_20069, partial [Cymbomonas tetramitiformis]
ARRQWGLPTNTFLLPYAHLLSLLYNNYDFLTIIDSVANLDMCCGVQEVATLLREMHANPFTRAKVGDEQHRLQAERRREEEAGRQQAQEARGAQDAGNAAFKEQKFDEAMAHYRQALDRYPPTSQEAVACLSNTAQCCLKLERFAAALEVCATTTTPH